MGMPQAEAATWGSALYFEKSDENGNPLGGSVWKIQYEEFRTGRYGGYFNGGWISETVIYHTYYVVDNLGDEEKREWRERYSGTDLNWKYEFLKSEYGIDDKSLTDGYKGYPEVEEPRLSADEFLQLQPVQDFIKNADKDYVPGYHSSDSGPYWLWGELTPEQMLREYTELAEHPAFTKSETSFLEDFDDLPGRIKTRGLTGLGSNANLGSPDWKAFRTSDIRFEEVGSPKGFGTCGPSSEKPEATVSLKSSGDYSTIPEIKSVTSSDSLPYTEPSFNGEVWGNGLAGTYAVANFVNCKIPEPTPTTSTVTETVTETPEPSTTTVTPPTTTVTQSSTVTTTVTPPATTVTAAPKTETTMATTTESATTTVTQSPATETVTETPQRETVTLTPEKETETVTETPQKETVTETPKTETVTHTPEKETVTATPKASTETSTVTAPQVTVTETPKQVTETVTLPQKTVTEQVPTTVVENKTETVKLPPVTVTETEKQEPVTVTETPEKATETMKVPDEKTTVVETKPGEPVTVTETPRENKPAVVTTSDTRVEDTPVEEETSENVTVVESAPQPSDTNTPRILASTGANVVGLVGIAGLLIGATVFIIRRKK